MSRAFFLGFSVLALPAVLACSSSAPVVSGSPTDAATGAPDTGSPSGDDAAAVGDASKPTNDGGYPLCDGGALAVDRFVTSVVSFTPGDCAGFGAAQMPAIVLRSEEHTSELQ